MLLSRLLSVRPGVTALTGGGGKTAAMYRLARELRREGMPLKAASAQAAEEYGVKKRTLYNRAVQSPEQGL